VVDSVQKTVRATIKAWVESLGLTPTPTVVQVEEPKPPAKTTLPTFGVEFGKESWTKVYRHKVGEAGGLTVLDFGEAATPAMFKWRCASEDDAEAFREQFRSRFLLAAMDSSDAETPVLKLDATFYGGYDAQIAIYTETGDNMVYPSSRETGVVDYWILAHSMMVAFPLLVLEPAPGIGIMDVLIEVGQPEDPFEMNDYGGP
jgi:hypothetical protein